MNPVSNRHEAGFSLLEVLVTLAIAGLIVSVTTELTRLLGKGAAVAQRFERQIDAVLGVERLVRAVVTTAAVTGQPIPAPVGPMGSASALTVLSLGPQSLMLSEPILMTLRIDGSVGDEELLLRWRDPVAGTLHIEAVLEHAEDLAFSYFDQISENRPIWAGTWDDPTVLPRAVLLRITMSDLGPPIDIVIRTDPTQSQMCATLPDAPSCLEGAGL